MTTAAAGSCYATPPVQSLQTSSFLEAHLRKFVHITASLQHIFEIIIALLPSPIEFPRLGTLTQMQSSGRYSFLHVRAYCLGILLGYVHFIALHCERIRSASLIGSSRCTQCAYWSFAPIMPWLLLLISKNESIP